MKTTQKPNRAERHLDAEIRSAYLQLKLAQNRLKRAEEALARHRRKRSARLRAWHDEAAQRSFDFTETIGTAGAFELRRRPADGALLLWVDSWEMKQSARLLIPDARHTVVGEEHMIQLAAPLTPEHAQLLEDMETVIAGAIPYELDDHVEFDRCAPDELPAMMARLTDTLGLTEAFEPWTHSDWNNQPVNEYQTNTPEGWLIRLRPVWRCTNLRGAPHAVIATRSVDWEPGKHYRRPTW